jgi:hypothetical protein
MELRQITEITSNIWFDTRLVKRPSLPCGWWSHLDEFRLSHVSIRIPVSCKSYISPTQASSIQGNTGDRNSQDPRSSLPASPHHLLRVPDSRDYTSMTPSKEHTASSNTFHKQRPQSPTPLRQRLGENHPRLARTCMLHQGLPATMTERMLD